MHSFTVKKNDAGQRLDKFLTKAVKGLPTSLMYKYIRTKKIKGNRKRTEQKYMLCEGDVIDLFIRDEFFGAPEKDMGAITRIQPRIEAVYEDENILLINKRPGVVVHEDSEAKENTLLMHVRAYLYQKGEYDPSDEQSFAPALCKRIDSNTGGIVIAAKNAAALREMNAKIKAGEINKFYLCAVHGRLKKKSDTHRGWLVKDSAENKVRIYDKKVPGAKDTITKYEVLSEKGDESLLRVELITGRTHQIRATMAYLGHPLIGDGKYGVNKNDRIKHQALYSYRLEFDFESSEGELGYLKGKSVEIDPESIDFVRWFGGVK